MLSSCLHGLSCQNPTGSSSTANSRKVFGSAQAELGSGWAELAAVSVHQYYPATQGNPGEVVCWGSGRRSTPILQYLIAV